jgi:hypothetical protein
VAKFIQCIKQTGTVVLLGGIVTMRLNEKMRLTDAYFNDSTVQSAISAGDIVEIPSFESTLSANVIDMGPWDASVEANYPPAIPGHSYYVSGSGQLTNGEQTETYVEGERIQYQAGLSPFWERVVSVSGILVTLTWNLLSEATELLPSTKYLLDYSDGEFDVTLPDVVTVGQEIQMLHIAGTVGDGPTYPQVLRNGELIAGEEDDVDLDYDGFKISLIYAGGDLGWVVS